MYRTSVAWSEVVALHAVLRIRDVYPGSEYFPSRIQGLKDSRIRIRIKEFKYIKQKERSRNYDPGCSSRIRILIFLPIPDPRVEKAPDPDRATLSP
jgi:hypothetical protein